MSPTTIQCPHCHQTISIDEALSHQLGQKFEQEYQNKLKAKVEQEKKQLTDLYKQRLQEERAKLAEEKTKIAGELEKNVGQEMALLKERLTKSEKERDEARQLELDLRKQKLALEDEQKNLALKLQRQLDEERTKLKAEIEKQTAETQELKVMELQKQLQDALKASEETRKANEELRRKLQQGSQQNQGEVLELELEKLIKTEFPLDEMQPVPKGIRGADIIQVVRDHHGRVCGSIIWELKHAQWSEGWLEKLREDQRASKADLAVLVSINLPKEITSFGQRQGIWVTNRSTCLALAHVLRQQLMQVAVTKLAAVGKNEKMEVLYNYLSGLEFKQRVEGIVEAFSNMQDDLEKEKRWFTSKWAKQEKNIRKVIDQTIGMHGDLQGIMGASLPEIKQLQLDSGETAAEGLFEPL